MRPKGGLFEVARARLGVRDLRRGDVQRRTFSRHGREWPDEAFAQLRARAGTLVVTLSAATVGLVDRCRW